MKKFSRCMLILMLVAVLGGIGGYVYGYKTLKPEYISVSELYVVPGVENEASLRNKNGGLNDDFEMVITNSSILGEAKKNLGTSENLRHYIDVYTLENSNIVVIECANVDAGTAKSYVDAVAAAAVNHIDEYIPIESVKILSKGTVEVEPVRPLLIYYVIGVAGVLAVACLLIELIVVLFMKAFEKEDEIDEAELDYERHYGKYATVDRRDVKTLKEYSDEDIVEDTVEDIHDNITEKSINVIGRIKK